MGLPALLTYNQSPLLRDAMREAGFVVWEYFNEGAYPEHQVQKAEVEGLVAQQIEAWDDHALEAALERNAQFLTDWAESRVAAAKSKADWARLAAFAELQLLVEDPVLRSIWIRTGRRAAITRSTNRCLTSTRR